MPAKKSLILLILAATNVIAPMTNANLATNTSLANVKKPLIAFRPLVIPLNALRNNPPDKKLNRVPEISCFFDCGDGKGYEFKGAYGYKH